MTVFSSRDTASEAKPAGTGTTPRRLRFSLNTVVATAASAAILSTSAPAVLAQELEPTEQGLTGVFDGLFDDSPLVEEEDDAPASSTREAAPNTDNCPQALLPPEPVTTSEVVAPGQQSPAPLPEVQYSNCGVQAPAGFDVNDDVRASAWMVRP